MTGAGDLRHRVTFQRAVVQADGGGGFQSVWVDLFSCWACLETIEPARGQALRPALDRAVSHKVTVRYGRDFVPETGMRIVWGDRSFLVLSIVNRDEAKIWIDMSVQENAVVDGLDV